MLRIRRCLLACFLLALGAHWAAGIPGAHAQPDELPLGSTLPASDATLTAVDGTDTTPAARTGAAATVFVFWSNQCLWIDKYEDRVTALITDFQDRGIAFTLVNANDASAFPRESLDASRSRARSADYPAPYVRDPTGAFATALGASRTPHAFVFDADRTLVYAGGIDDSPTDPDGVTTPYLRNALSALVNGNPVPTADTKAFGCTIKLPQ